MFRSVSKELFTGLQHSLALSVIRGNGSHRDFCSLQQILKVCLCHRDGELLMQIRSQTPHYGALCLERPERAEQDIEASQSGKHINILREIKRAPVERSPHRHQ